MIFTVLMWIALICLSPCAYMFYQAGLNKEHSKPEQALSMLWFVCIMLLLAGTIHHSLK